MGETRELGDNLSSCHSLSLYFPYSLLRDRYPRDGYDRIWFARANRTGWTTVSRDQEIKSNETGTESLPQVVLRTAIVYEDLSFTVTVGSDEKIVIFLYFAELQLMRSNDTREFYVLQDGQLLYGPYRPSYLQGETLYTGFPTGLATKLCTLNSTSNSTRPPMINAREVYGLKRLESSPTDSGDGQFQSPIDIVLLSFHFAGSSERNGRSFTLNRERDLEDQRRVQGKEELAGGSLPSTGAGVGRSGLPLPYHGDSSDCFSVRYLAPRTLVFKMFSFGLDLRDEYC